MTAKELREKRAEVVIRMQDLRKDVADNMTSEQKEQWDKMDAEQMDLLSRAETLERIEKLNAITQSPVQDRTTRTGYIGPHDTQNAIRHWALNYSGHGHLTNDTWASAANRCGLNSETLIVRNGQADQSTTAAYGGYTISGDQVQGIERSMKAYNGVERVARVIKTSQGNSISWATNDDTGNTGVLVSELPTLSATYTAFGTKALTAYAFSSLVTPVSLELIQDSAVDFVGLMSDLLGERLGRVQCTYNTTGTGSSQPGGVAYESALGVTADAEAEILPEDLIDLLHSVDIAYRQSASCNFMMHDTTFAAIRKMQGDDGKYLWGPGLNGAPDTLLGYPVVINNSMAEIAASAKVVLFGDFSKFIIRQVRDIQVRVLNERYVESNAVGFIAFSRMDSCLINPAAVKHIVCAAGS